MNMKKIISSLALLLLLFSTSFAQQEAPKQSAQIAVGVVYPFGIENENASETLQNNILQALSLNGLAAQDSRFMIVPKVAVLSKDVTPTAPPKFVLELEVSLFMVDLYTQVVMSQTSFNVKGVGNDDGKAFIAAVRNVQSRNSKLKTMILTGKEKIISYFDAEGTQILGRIQAHIDRKDYESALIEAYAIPSACAELYNKASELIAKIPFEKKKEIVITPTIINNYYYTEPVRDRVAIYIQ